jgi:hypothetical protein
VVDGRTFTVRDQSTCAEDPAMHIELTPEEGKALKHALEVYLSDLRMEIVDTDSQDFREGLKHEKQLLEAVVSRIKS